MAYDVVIVGAGPSGLAAAIRLKQLAAEQEREVSVCVLEKGSEVGAHILSGAVPGAARAERADPRLAGAGRAARHAGRPRTSFLYLTETQGATGCRRRRRCTTTATTSSASAMSCRWLAAAGRGAGRRDLSGLRRGRGALRRGRARCTGVATGDMGIGKDGEHGPNYQPGMELHAKLTLFAEGCRGSLTKTLMERFNLRDGVAAADLRPRRQGAVGDRARPARKPGKVVHTIGWPMDSHDLWRLLALHVRRTTWSRSASSSGSTTTTRICRRSTRCSASRPIPRSGTIFEGGRRIAYGARALSRGRLPVDPEAGLPGRRPDRRHGGLPQRAQDQGHPHRDEVRHGRGRGGVRRRWRAAPSAGARRPTRSG